MNLVLVSLLIGLVITFFIYSLVVSLSTLEDLKWRDWLTFRPYQYWLSEFKDLFSFTIFSFSTVTFSLVFWVQLKLSTMDRDATSKEECVCYNCKACQTSLKLSRAAVAYLGLNAEDIEELSKDHLVETNLVANPISK